MKKQIKVKIKINVLLKKKLNKLIMYGIDSKKIKNKLNNGINY